MKILPGDLDDPCVRDLLKLHLTGMQENSPPDSVYALDLSGLAVAEVSLWTAWDGDELLSCGAIKELSPTSAEIKSMRTYPRHLRKGAGRALLQHMLTLARSRGYARVSLETGTSESFVPALALYRAAGFTNGEPFADYEASDFNQFLHLDL